MISNMVNLDPRSSQLSSNPNARVHNRKASTGEMSMKSDLIAYVRLASLPYIAI